MSRVRKFYELDFNRLLRNSGCRDPQAETVAHFEHAAQLARRDGLSATHVLARLHAELRWQSGETRGFPDRFVCDAGLGGLARWLRATGYEASWPAEEGDAALIREARRVSATLVTTDTLMMERGVLRDGEIPAVCLPSSLRLGEQLELLFTALGLRVRAPRCMTCGGELRVVEKQTVADRIPPKTARWLDEYFLCTRCDRLFWRGTHWQRIAKTLAKVKAQSSKLKGSSKA
ncbi:MAG TPA: Mut7-C RNAse domain-containing protein [Verrucomicrobiae bacterium]|jgi:uncharacterized protein with PIN domain